jgi:branched-chain amino acid transport system ATP-binding protein
MAGVNPELTDRLLARIDDLQSEQGMTFVIVEHDMDVIMSISDKVIGMHNGEVLSVGTPEEVKQDEQMLEAYLGGTV